MLKPLSFFSFFRNRSGRLVVAQAPNAAIWVFVLATALRWTPYDAHDLELRWIASGALIVWAGDELFRGASPFRRLLGLVVLTWQLVGLFG